MDKILAPIKQRILQYIDYKGLKKGDFFEDADVSASNFRSKSLYSEVGGDVLAKISSIYLDINIDWLITGEGSMLKEIGNTLPLINKDSKGVPYYDVDFIGGFDLVIGDNTMNPSFYIDFKPFNSADYWVNITGKSMSPFISHGDIVALQEFSSWKNGFILNGEIYAIVTEDFRTIKIMRQSENKDCYTLIPYNKSDEFKAQDIPKEMITAMFKVKGSIKKFF